MIKSSPFGPTILSGEDAEKFLEQIKSPAPNRLAQESLERGRKLLALQSTAESAGKKAADLRESVDSLTDIVQFKSEKP